MGFLNRILGTEPEPEPNPPEPNPAESAGFMQRVRQGLQKTARILNTDVRDLFKREGEDGRLVDDQFF